MFGRASNPFTEHAVCPSTVETITPQQRPLTDRDSKMVATLFEQAGRRWWKFSGAVYMLRAVKRVPGMRLITPCWQKKTLRNKALQPLLSQFG